MSLKIFPFCSDQVHHTVKFQVIILSLFILIYSCAPLYIPNNANAPLLCKKGEGAFGLNYGLSGVNLHSAYAPMESFAVMLNYSYINSTNESSDYDDEYLRKQSFGEVAIGYFYEINEYSVVEVYFGGGMGKASSIDDFLWITNDKIHADGNYYRLFIQPDFGFKSKIFEGGIALRACYVSFTKIQYENYDAEVSTSNYFLEPVAFMRFGGPLIKFQAQLGFSRKIDIKDFVTYDPFIVGFGLSVRFGSKL
jgi:hypothetical protein